MPGAGVEVRLEENEHATAVAERRECRFDLRRVMRVVVVDLDPVRLATSVEPPGSPGELGEHRRDLLPGQSNQLECTDRARGIAAVVLARDGPWAVVGRPPPAPGSPRDGPPPALAQIDPP